MVVAKVVSDLREEELRGGEYAEDNAVVDDGVVRRYNGLRRRDWSE